MKEKKKKRIIAVLLLVSCIVSALLLVYSIQPTAKALQSFARADSLLYNDFYKFNLKEEYIKVRSVTVDSNLTRKNFTIAVPPGFSKTQLHNELNRTLHDFNIQTPAEIIFPYKDFRIQLVYHNTVFRSITLTTDPELTLNRNFGSVLVAFEEVPSQQLIDEIVSFGEPISIALIVENPLEANDLKSELNTEYERILFWLKDGNGNTIPGTESPRILSSLQHLQDAVPGAGVISFQSLANNMEEEYRQIFSKTRLHYVDASKAILLDAELGKPAFMQELNKFAKQAARYQQPVAIVMGNKESLQWLKTGLNELKKSGLEIVPVQKNRF